MRGPGRTATVVLVVGVVGALPLAVAAPAWAAGAKKIEPKVIQSNWYWDRQTDQASSATIGTPLEGVTEPSGVPKGDLAVAYVNGSEPNKSTYLAFDQSTLTQASKVTSFRVTLTLDPASPQVKATPPELVACLPVRQWNNGAGDSAAFKPFDECDGAPHGKWNDDATEVTFTITGFAQDWVDDVNTGVAIRNDPEATDTAPFQVAFLGDKDVAATMSYVPVVVRVPQSGDDGGTPQTQPGDQPVAQPPADTPPVDTGSGFTGDPGISSGSSGIPPVDTGTSTVPGPTVADDSGGGDTVASSAAAAIAPASSAPTAGFWVAAVGLALLLGLIYLVARDNTPAPVAASTRSSRLDHVLRSRRATADSTPRSNS